MAAKNSAVLEFKSDVAQNENLGLNAPMCSARKIDTSTADPIFVAIKHHPQVAHLIEKGGRAASTFTIKSDKETVFLDG